MHLPMHFCNIAAQHDLRPLSSAATHPDSGPGNWGETTVVEGVLTGIDTLFNTANDSSASAKPAAAVNQ
jgi:hypothetical protein